jgi:hypothetical protein
MSVFAGYKASNTLHRSQNEAGVSLLELLFRQLKHWDSMNSPVDSSVTAIWATETGRFLEATIRPVKIDFTVE